MKESDIRNPEAFKTYLRMAKEDVETFFRPETLVKRSCPSCASSEADFAFEKNGFPCVTCRSCETLYVNSVPTAEDLGSFYADAPSSRYWVTDFFTPVAEARRELIFRPRAEFITERFGPFSDWSVADVGAGFGLFLEELGTLQPDNRFIAIEPSMQMAQICRDKNLAVIECMFEDLADTDERFDLITVFELTEHLLDPRHFFTKALEILNPGGWLYLTTLSGKGFDIQVMWEQSRAVSPPHHLNFFSPHSLSGLLRSIGFSEVEATTPGKLDWDIVEGAMKREGFSAGRFWDGFAQRANEKAKTELQDWIVNNKMSSHMHVLARKPDDYLTQSWTA